MSLEDQMSRLNVNLEKLLVIAERAISLVEKPLSLFKEGPPKITADTPDEDIPVRKVEPKPAAKPAAAKPAAKKAEPAKVIETAPDSDPDGGDDDDPKTEISVNYLSDKVKALAAATNRGAVIAIFKLFGAERLPDITKDKYPALDLALTKAISKAKEVK